MPMLRYAVGEWPEPVDYSFLDADGNPISMAGYTPTATIEDPDGVIVGYDDEVEVTDAPNGTVTFTWPDDTLDTAGTYTLMIWVESASARYASEPIAVHASDRGGIPDPTP